MGDQVGGRYGVRSIAEGFVLLTAAVVVVVVVIARH